MSNAMYFDGECSLDYGIILTKPPARIVPERQAESIAVPGRSGNLTIDGNRYNNYRLPVKCAIIPRPGQTLREAVTAAMPFLQPTAGYRRFETTYDSSVYMMVKISGTLNVESIVDQAGTFTMNLDCKPQRFLIAGETSMEVKPGQFIDNPTTEAAVPLLRVVGTAGGLLMIGDEGVLIQFRSQFDTEEIWVDCEAQEAWQVVDGVVINANQYLTTAEFPRIAPGRSLITFPDSFELVEIIPRWWTT